MSAVFKLSIAVFGIVGIQLQLGLFTQSPNWSMFTYFTNLSNLACVIYFICAVIWVLTVGTLKNMTFCPLFKGIVTMSITVTMLIAQCMLNDFPMNGTMGIALILLHQVVPIMTILDWVIFDEKGQITKRSPVIWICAPLIYFAYSMIATQINGDLGNGSRYPYPFIDVDALGAGTVALTVIVLVAAFIALGYLYYGVDHLLAGFAQKKKKEFDCY